MSKIYPLQPPPLDARACDWSFLFKTNCDWFFRLDEGEGSVDELRQQLLQKESLLTETRHVNVIGIQNIKQYVDRSLSSRIQIENL